MASAVLANHNEPNWPQHRGGGAGFMGKVPPFSNSNPNPNPKFSNRRTQSPSDDASSINRRSNDGVSTSQYVTFNIASLTKKEIAELRRRFVSELERVRQLNSRIESAEFQIQQPTASYNGSSGKKSAPSKKVSGNKRPFPLNSSKESKRSHSQVASLMKSCGQVLQKLMKHKFGWIFNVPVDVVGLGLHDYNTVIKKPMDLGTVKSKLSKNLYASPSEFALDVRLTFNNALKYNPKGHEVYILAEQFLARFEELYRPLGEKFEKEEQVFDEVLQASSWNLVESDRVERVKERVEKVKKKEKENPIPKPKLQEPIPVPVPVLQQLPAPASSLNPPSVQSPVRTPSPMRAPLVKPLKQPKPKARDPNKREMSLEEKHKLGLGLQDLPSEKMEQVVQIIRKRNGNLEQDGDEIELDIEAVDTETLWELDRLVTNYKKMVSKIKRQALMGNNNNVTSNNGNGELTAIEKVDITAPVEAKKPKKMEAAMDEDVDIGDDMPMNNFPPVEIEKDKDVVGGHASSSSSSSGSSSSDDDSSSSDSDSGSSSGSDSDADNGHL